MFILKSLKIGKIRIFYYIPFEQNDVLQQLISAAAAQTANEMRNLSGSLGFAVRNADGTVHFTEIGKFYMDTVDNAINGIANGVFDYNTAIKRRFRLLRTADFARLITRNMKPYSVSADSKRKCGRKGRKSTCLKWAGRVRTILSPPDAVTGSQAANIPGFQRLWSYHSRENG